jgi:hypothetical protein
MSVREGDDRTCLGSDPQAACSQAGEHAENIYSE